MEEILNRIVNKELFFDRIREDLEKAINEYLNIGYDEINCDY
jgi:hypothetical protein